MDKPQAASRRKATLVEARKVLYHSNMPRIALLGGTGSHGAGLALRFGAAGAEVAIGSRDATRAADAAQRVQARLAKLGVDRPVQGAENATVVGTADIIALTVPFSALGPLLAEVAPALAGKVVLDVINPVILADNVFKMLPVPGGSVGQFIQTSVPSAQVVSGFKHVSARALWRAQRLKGDVLLCGDAPVAKRAIQDLVRSIPDLRAVDAGPLVHATYLENLTALLLNLNRQHRVVTSVQILGLEPHPA